MSDVHQPESKKQALSQLHHPRGKRARFISARNDSSGKKQDRIPPPFDTPHLKENPRPPNANQTCIFCKISGSVPECEGLLLGPFKQVRARSQISFYAHTNCAIWHPLVFEQNNQLTNVDEALKFSRGKLCYACNQKGATLGCAHNGKRCCRSTHFRCALRIGANLFNFEVRCPRHNNFSYDQTQIHKFIERTPLEDGALRYSNTCMHCSRVNYDYKNPQDRLLTCNACCSRTHTKCTVIMPEEFHQNFVINSFKGKHLCEKCMTCGICDKRVDHRAYAIRKQCVKLKQNSELDWDFTQESNEDCNVLLCVGCNHFAVHIDCLGSHSSQPRWRCDLCYTCRHCSRSVPRNEWNEQHEACDTCYRRIKKDGVICPVCRKLYREDDCSPMIQCDACDRWIHADSCGGLTTPQFRAFNDDSKKYFCPICMKKRENVRNGRIKHRLIVERLLTFGGSIPKSLVTVLRKIPAPYFENAFYNVQTSNKDAKVSPKVLQDLAIDVDICRRCCTGVTKGRSKCCITCGDFFHEYCIRCKPGFSFDLTTSKHNFWQCQDCSVSWNAQAYFRKLSDQPLQDSCDRHSFPEKASVDMNGGTHRLVRWNDERKCEFCLRGERRKGKEGPLIAWSSSMNCDLSDIWVHVGCVLLSSGMALHQTSETCFTIVGHRRSVMTSAKRSRCAKCGKNGATIKCSVNTCGKLHHFHCSTSAGVSCMVRLKGKHKEKTPKIDNEGLVMANIESMHIVCKKHKDQQQKRNRSSWMKPCDIPKLIEAKGMVRVVDSQGYLINPDADKKRVVSMNRKVKMRVGSTAVVHFGEIIPEVNDFIVEGCLVPLGYCAVRRFWSMSKFGKRCTYFFEVRGHAQSGPIFVIRCSEDLTMRLESRDVNEIWGTVWRKVMEVQLKRKIDKSGLCRSGLDMFGLSNCESIVRHIESLPLAGMFSGRYKSRCNIEITNDEVLFYKSLSMKYLPPDIPTNTSESARVQGYRRRLGHKKDQSGPCYENIRSGSAFQMQVAREMLYDNGESQGDTLELKTTVIEGTRERRGDLSHGRGRRISLGGKPLSCEVSGRRNIKDGSSDSGRGRKRRRSAYKARTVPKIEDKEAKLEVEDVAVEVEAGSIKNSCLAPLAKHQTIILRSEIDGWGVFATEDIAAEELIIEYVGEIIRPSLSDIREQQYLDKGVGCYMFEIIPGEIVDATMCGNAARYINHSCVPNCYSKTIWTGTKAGQPRQQVVAIFSKRPIQRGEELSYDYQFPYDENDRVICGCGAEQCKGFMN